MNKNEVIKSASKVLGAIVAAIAYLAIISALGAVFWIVYNGFVMWMLPGSASLSYFQASSAALLFVFIHLIASFWYKKILILRMTRAQDALNRVCILAEQLSELILKLHQKNIL